MPNKSDLLTVLTAIAEMDRPTENTGARLMERTGLDEETVAACLDVLYNEGAGWLDYGEHPRTLERGYFCNAKFDKGKETLDQLIARHLRGPKKAPGKAGTISLVTDDEDDEDEWADIDKDDDPDDQWEDP